LTDRQTDKHRRLHNLLGGRKDAVPSICLFNLQCCLHLAAVSGADCFTGGLPFYTHRLCQLTIWCAYKPV